MLRLKMLKQIKIIYPKVNAHHYLQRPFTLVALGAIHYDFKGRSKLLNRRDAALRCIKMS